MTLISKKYRNLNTKLHASRPGFGAFGHRWTDDVKHLAAEYDTFDILDYGCGKATLASSLDFPIHCYDPAVHEYSGDPKPCAIVICTDVLEHVEPENLRDVLQHIHSLTKSVAFLNISTRLANKRLADGRNAHLIVKPSTWWYATLTEFFDVEAIDLSPTEYNVLVFPK